MMYLSARCDPDIPPGSYVFIRSRWVPSNCGWRIIKMWPCNLEPLRDGAQRHSAPQLSHDFCYGSGLAHKHGPVTSLVRSNLFFEPTLAVYQHFAAARREGELFFFYTIAIQSFGPLPSRWNTFWFPEVCSIGMRWLFMKSRADRMDHNRCHIRCRQGHHCLQHWVAAQEHWSHGDEHSMPTPIQIRCFNHRSCLLVTFLSFFCVSWFRIDVSLTWF